MLIKESKWESLSVLFKKKMRSRKGGGENGGGKKENKGWLEK